ncbi:hypothetical protein [Pseudomonas sp. MWU12-2323]|uniref:hypothetical protein n=1 Tax=Pseudomonas sp. MWU12-2323 TaxID=2651296 RepID=UPI00128B3F5A|nr:hypothetical protein [Pseudomonas sp. MWU12-2323]MPQ69369.1 hypothetical protein [Pseudomonas sp. MWU12-2323]
MQLLHSKSPDFKKAKDTGAYDADSPRAVNSLVLLDLSFLSVPCRKGIKEGHFFNPQNPTLDPKVPSFWQHDGKITTPKKIAPDE